ncbi:hypothetical protein UCRPA7_4598 [Phaeoacremonium minimum UCRPA7]|uniref:Uncharacterized protein n=1 Tax=Phaeoacremonium minimum (strain UCR-PA7) TaxID=1286976 RepID=R8BKN0_PHAM7|nr:hypothetical protein UCRPA7_4598 [Phaeoacremonium minimum UCRPA7]EON99875.1 hypothetical protein UCRPA7_4598 [Phaeoacremonium minimum UCRPA7]
MSHVPCPMMSDAWFAEKLAPDGDTIDGCHPQQAQALKQYLREEMSAQSAARAITQPVLEAENPVESLQSFWGFLVDALIELPSRHTGGLVTLLQAVQDLPEPDTTAPGCEKLRRKKLWRELPGFGHQYADAHQWQDCRKLYTTAAAATDNLEQKRLQDYNTKKAKVEAHLVEAGLLPIDWGYETVADALEASSAVLDLEVPAAAEWLVILGPRFRAGAAKGEQSWALARQRDLWKGGGGSMTRERYSFWAERLGSLSLQACEAATLRAAAAAREAMWRQQGEGERGQQ